MSQITPDVLPDFHFLMIAPNLEAAWFFRGARLYYDRFTPTVITDAELLGLLEPEVTVTVSLLTRRDAFEPLAVAVLQNRPDALIDALIYDSVREAATALNARARAGQPFGVPLQPTPVPPTRQPITPTLGSVLDGGGVTGPPTATPNASGFVTQAPTAPPGFITQTPSPTPPADTDPEAPFNPTPGPITGG